MVCELPGPPSPDDKRHPTLRSDIRLCNGNVPAGRRVIELRRRCSPTGAQATIMNAGIDPASTDIKALTAPGCHLLRRKTRPGLLYFRVKASASSRKMIWPFLLDCRISTALEPLAGAVTEIEAVTCDPSGTCRVVMP
jgi:hypothetical protein